MITKQELETIKAKAPLLSEGAISSFQVSNMSKREKTERERNVSKRFNLEAKYKKENMTEEEKEEENKENILMEIENLKIKIDSTKRIILYHKELRAFQSGRMNNTKRAVINDEEENNGRELKIIELQRRLKE